MTSLLYTVAKDKNGILKTANEAEKGCDFFCPICNKEVILKKSGNIYKGAKRPHFAHRVLTPNCTPESVLHYSFKILLAKKISDYLENSLPLLISWDCIYCGSSHTGNLLKKIKSIKVEHNLIVCKPDIALFNENNNIHAVIEIVVSHKPEEKVLSYYRQHNIILIQINLTSDQDIDFIDERITRPSFVGTCFHPKCKSCGNPKQKKIMLIIDGHCKRCNAILKVPAIISSSRGILRGSNFVNYYKFSSTEINIAKSKGVSFKSNGTGLTIACKKCHYYIDNFHIFTEYIFPADLGELASDKFQIGYCCETCEN